MGNLLFALRNIEVVEGAGNLRSGLVELFGTVENLAGEAAADSSFLARSGRVLLRYGTATG